MVKRALIPHPENSDLVLVPLANGKWFAVIDKIDAEAVGQHNWCAMSQRRTTYATSRIGKGNYKPLYLHRLVAKLAGVTADLIDHEDRDGLNCRRNNLRPATRSKNNANAGRRNDNTSGFRGVTFHKKLAKWQASIQVDGSSHYIGVFTSPEEAGRAYDEKAREAFGEFAMVNFTS